MTKKTSSRSNPTPKARSRGTKTGASKSGNKSFKDYRIDSSKEKAVDLKALSKSKPQVSETPAPSYQEPHYSSVRMEAYTMQRPLSEYQRSWSGEDSPPLKSLDTTITQTSTPGRMRVALRRAVNIVKRLWSGYPWKWW